MSASEPLCLLMGIDPKKLSKEESIILEAELLTRIFIELEKSFIEEYQQYHRLLKFNIDTEKAMLEGEFIKLIIKDILATEEYTLNGIASYADIPEDLVSEVIIGNITNPSMRFFRKIVELHRTVRADLYRDMMKRITTDCIFQ